MTQLLPAIMRTGVPIIYALLIKFGIARLGLPDAVVTDVATVLLTVALYVILRLLERLQPWIGMALGWAKQPQYADVVQGEVTSVRDDLLDDLKAEVTRLKSDTEDVAAAIKAKTMFDKTIQKAAQSATVTVPAVAPVAPAPIVPDAAAAVSSVATDTADDTIDGYAAADTATTVTPDLSTLRVPALRNRAKALAITGYSSMKKAELITAIKAAEKKAQKAAAKSAQKKGA